jgi:hypothetical protein
MKAAAVKKLLESRYTPLRKSAPHLFDGKNLKRPTLGLEISSDLTIVTKYFKMLGVEDDKEIRIDRFKKRNKLSTLYKCGSNSKRKEDLESGTSGCIWQAQVRKRNEVNMNEHEREMK